MNIIPDDEPKINNWQYYKRQAATVSRHMKIVAEAAPQYKERAWRMEECGRQVIYRVDGSGVYHYEGAWLCRDRLCPVCAWRLSIKRCGEMIRTIERLHECEPHTKAIHVVFTVRNCVGSELRRNLQELSKGFTRLKKKTLWNEHVLGYVRSIEITYNSEWGTYHPHIHCICIVKDTYTRQISIGDWIAMWRECMRIDYNPVVYAKHAYKNPDKYQCSIEYSWSQDDDDVPSNLTIAAQSAVIEACKYAVKPISVTEIAKDGEMKTLVEALSGLRMVSYGGNIKRYRAELGYTDRDIPNEQLPSMSINPADAIGDYWIIYEWCKETRSYVKNIKT